MTNATPKKKKRTDHVERLLSFSKPFNPATDDEARDNGFAFNKLPPGDRDFRLGVLMMAIALTLRHINKRLIAIDSIGLDVRDELADLNNLFVQMKPPDRGGDDQANDDDGDDGDGDGDDDDDGDDDGDDGDGGDDGDDDEPSA